MSPADEPATGTPDAAATAASSEAGNPPESGNPPSRTTHGRAAQLESSQMRPGWTTGACATAAARAAWVALHTGGFPDPVTIRLPHGREAAFALTAHSLSGGTAMAAVTKDAGDDPDVTHGAIVRVWVRRGEPGSGVVFEAGPGVGHVTLPGLPLPVGEPAINPVPRRYLTENLHLARAALSLPSTDAIVTIGVDDGEELARHTWNARVGVLGGLSILGTTGVVIPYSCSAWIASIHEGIDVAVATGARHVGAATGSTSEQTLTSRYPGIFMLDMGDFAGAVLKYLAKHPVPRLTICGGFAKISKLANGLLDLHSHRTSVDTAHLAALAASAGADAGLVTAIEGCNTAAEALGLFPTLGDLVADAARRVALDLLTGSGVEVEVLCTDRAGTVVGQAG